MATLSYEISFSFANTCSLLLSFPPINLHSITHASEAGAQKTSPYITAVYTVRLCNLSHKCRGNCFNLLQVPNGASAEPCVQFNLSVAG